MIYQHKNSIPELKDLSEQRYLMRLQQKQKDPIQQQFQQQSTYSLNLQDPYLNQINDHLKPIQIQQMYIGKSEQKQFVNQDMMMMDEFLQDKNQQSPFAHRTNQQRSKTISLMNYKEIRNNSQENSQKGMSTTSNQQGNQAYYQQQEGNKRDQLQYQATSTLANNLMNLQSPTDNSYKKYDTNLDSVSFPHNQIQLLNQQPIPNQQQSNNINNITLDYAPHSNQVQYLNQLQTPQSTIHQYQVNRTNNHQQIFLDCQNNGVRSNSQQAYLDPATASVRGNSQQHNIDLNGPRSNSQQGFHNYSVGTPHGIKQNYNHFLSQNQILTNQTQGLTNLTTTNNNNSLESLIDLENKWSDIKRVHQNFQQRSLSNSSSSNSIAQNHRPNSSLNVSTNNNLSFINASSALVDQANNSKTFQNSSMPQTPFESKLEKQNSIQTYTNNNNNSNSNNNNNKLIKKVVPLSKINLNSLIQTTGTNSFMNSNQFSAANSSKNTKVKFNLQGSFQEQMIYDKSTPFESQSLPGSTRGHHDSFQGLNYNQHHSTQNNNQSQSQLYEFDSRPTQNISSYQNKIQEYGQNNNLSMFSLHPNNQYIDSGFLSHQVSQAHSSSTNELYSSAMPKQSLNNVNLYQQNIYQISSAKQQNQILNPITTHQKSLSYQDLKPQQQSFKSNSISIQENYYQNSQLDNNLSNYLECKVSNQHNNSNSMNNMVNIVSKPLNSNTNLQQKVNRNQNYQNYSQSPNKTNEVYLNSNQHANTQFNNTQLINNPNYVSFEQKQGSDQFNNFNYQNSQFQYGNHLTANFKQPNSFTQDLNDLPLIYSNQCNQKSFTTSSTKENNESKSKNQDFIHQSPQIHDNYQQRQNYGASPSSLQAQKSHNAQSKERKSPNSKNASDIKLKKKSQEEVVNVQEQTKKKTYSEQQFEFMKQHLPTYTQNITKKNLFSQALAQQKGSFDLNSVLPNQNAQNQLDFTLIQEQASENEIDNHLQVKYNEYKQRIQQQQRENNGNQGQENIFKTATSNIYSNSYIQATINHTQNQSSFSSKKRPSTFQNSNQAQNQKEVQLKNHYYTTNISEIIKDQRNYSNECNDKISLSQKLIDQENRNPNNTQVRQLDHESLLKLKQGLKHSNSQGQNEFLQIQMQMQQQYQSVNNGNACNNQHINQITQQKTYSPRVNYKIISENIKKQKFGVIQKNEKIIQNNQAEQSKKSCVYNPSQNMSNQSQPFFPDQLLAPVSKSFIETKKVQTNSNVTNPEKSVNEMYENNKLNSNNLNAINKKNSKLTEIPIKQVVSKKILPKYQPVVTDISEDLINNNNSGNLTKTIQQNIKTYQKTQADEPKKKKLSITQAELNVPQSQNSQKIQQQVPQSTKYNCQQIGFSKPEDEKITLKRQHSSSTSNAIYDPFKLLNQDQQVFKGQQPANQQNNANYEYNQKISDTFGNENNNAQNNQNRQSYLLNKNNPSSNYSKMQCMPCNKNLVEAKQQKKEEQLKITKGKVEQKLELNKEILQNPSKSISGAYSKLSQQPQQLSQQPKTYSSFIIPNLVFN
ncbi:hypothetical protein ABPG72_012842 [Tetrahymena utriculariae]